jgi:truncated hemoglobin YjbI
MVRKITKEELEQIKKGMTDEEINELYDLAEVMAREDELDLGGLKLKLSAVGPWYLADLQKEVKKARRNELEEYLSEVDITSQEKKEMRLATLRDPVTEVEFEDFVESLEGTATIIYLRAKEAQPEVTKEQILEKLRSPEIYQDAVEQMMILARGSGEGEEEGPFHPEPELSEQDCE